MRTGDTAQATFGETIRKLRLEKGLSQLQIADRVGIDVTYLSKIENDRVPAPAEDVVRRLAGIFGRAHEELLLLGDRVPAGYARQIRDDSLVADFFRRAPELKPSQRQRIQRIIDESVRG